MFVLNAPDILWRKPSACAQHFNDATIDHDARVDGLLLLKFIRDCEGMTVGYGAGLEVLLKGNSTTYEEATVEEGPLY